MGKPYASEVAVLEETYTEAIAANPEPVARAISSIGHSPLLAVGSGGSLTSAYFACLIHEAFTGQLSKPMTPLEIVAPDPVIARSATMFFSAGGKNRDILLAFEQARRAEARRLIVVCGQPNSPLHILANETPDAHAIAFRFPGGRDGFLATNSLLASCVRLLRGYQVAFGVANSLPSTLHELTVTMPGEQLSKSLSHASRPLWQREYLILLHGRATRPGAMDIESRFHEAALGPVQIADYRNFAHGRHHWLAKRGRQSSIIAFVTPNEVEVAKRTLSLIPRTVPVLRLETSQIGPHAALGSIIWSILIAASAGDARAIDPGRPGVPGFGRKIYNLRSSAPRPGLRRLRDETRLVAAERKTGLGQIAATVGRPGVIAADALLDFQRRMARARFGGLVIDFDGTLCANEDKGNKLKPVITHELERIIRAGIIVGIATGRGKSVRNELRRSIPKNLWPRVIVGYYNGSDIATLDDTTRPNGNDGCEGELAAVADALQREVRFEHDYKVTCRRHQITVEPTGLVASEAWSAVNDFVIRLGTKGVDVLRSAHSVDIVSPKASKRRVVDEVSLRVKRSSVVLCMGDRGRWPGNDYELLSLPYSLSVDEVSFDPLTCWNLSPPGVRGVEAGLYYLKALRAKNGLARITL